jgi:hypothetical protein
MYADRIAEVFHRYNYQPGAQMNQQNLYNFLSQLTVLLNLVSLGRPMIDKLLSSSGNNHLKELILSILAAFAEQSVKVSAFSKSN